MAIKEFGNGVNQVTKIGLKSGEVWEVLWIFGRRAETMRDG